MNCYSVAVVVGGLEQDNLVVEDREHSLAVHSLAEDNLAEDSLVVDSLEVDSLATQINHNTSDSFFRNYLSEE